MKIIGEHTQLYMIIVYQFTGAIAVSGIVTDNPLALKWCVIISMTLGGILGFVRPNLPGSVQPSPAAK